ncbi:MAG TPA: ABC transporter permease [Aggregatilineales bacterium]|jgi:peptide/nickel transport system permease protein|nr:ABC transporter permease [Aggregatilineales bacterium]
MSASDTTRSTPITRLDAAPAEHRTLLGDAVAHLLRDRLTMAALITLLLLTLLCAFGPPLLEATGLDATRTNTRAQFQPPLTGEHLLGTDHLGRDQLLRLLYGGRVSLMVAYLTSVLIVVIGVTLGLVAGYFGGLVDDLLAWMINTLSSIPPIFLLLIASALWQPSPEMLVILLAVTSWVGTSRLVRGEVLSLRERDFILSARALGASNRRLITDHIFPNLLSLVIVTGTIIAGNLILIESGLSYLGVGIQPPTPSWGNMLTDSRSYFVTGAHLVVFPGLLIFITVLCFYLVGDGLRDALDPRRNKRVETPQ